jgi:hypothetical protein
MFRCYGSRAVVGIRRHLKHEGDSISLARLLHQMESCGPQITFAYYLTRFPRDQQSVNWQPKPFRLFSDDGNTVSPSIIERDLEELKRLNTDIEEYVDRAIAHLDKRGHSVQVGFQDIEGSLDHFNRLACRSICFLTGKGYPTLEATVQFNWEQVRHWPSDLCLNETFLSLFLVFYIRIIFFSSTGRNIQRRQSGFTGQQLTDGS